MTKVETHELADIGQRFIALFIDGFILGVIGGALFGSAGASGGAVGFLIGAFYQWFFLTRNNGQTPGKALMKIRVIAVNGAPLTDAAAILRYIGYYINSAVLLIGWLWALWDPNHQGWHDKIASTYVVRVES